jgi:putative DNA primase/helicase
VNSALQNVLSRLKGVKKVSKGHEALCPAHNDTRTSLKVDAGEDGRVLLKCWAGCEVDDICRAIGLSVADLFPKKQKAWAGKKAPIVATYDYHDSQGNLLFQVYRTADKRFFQGRPDGKGGRVYGLDGVEPVPYRLPQVIQAVQAGGTVLIPEGEKDVNNLVELGLTATCNPMGAGKWRDRYSDYLSGASVVILPDNDEPGRRHAEEVARSLHGKATSVKVLELPNLPEKGDVSDWLEAGGTKEGLLLLAAQALEYEPPQRKVTVVENLTDLGNGKRFTAMADGNMRYLVERKQWLVWTGRRWTIDKTGAAMRLAKETALSIYGEVDLARDEDERVRIAKHAIRSESEHRLKAMINLAQSEPGIPITQGKLDRDLWLLNCENGTIDLRTGELRTHRREDFITKLCPVEYDPEARSALLEFFLQGALPDVDVRRYVQKAMGYSLTGSTELEKLFFAYGPSATGKSTLLAAVEATLGDYAATANFESFLQRSNVSGTPRNDIARLVGKRFVISVEVEDGKRMAEGLVNQLTGGDTVTARFLYSEEFEFRPQFKLWLAANNRPSISGPEGAIWRRLVQIPFLKQVPEDERDPEVKARLRDAERQAVLAWLVQGCLLWQKEGLDEPEAVRKITGEYREESDPLRDFLEECCVLNPMAEADNSELWRTYQEWCNTNGVRYPLGRKRFSQTLFERGLDQYQQGGSRARTWIGIGILNTLNTSKS